MSLPEFTNEKELVKNLKKGDEKAFVSIYQQYHRQLFVIALKYLKDDVLAQDIVQDIFVKLWTFRNNLQEDLSLKGFLVTAVRNLVLNTIRNKKTEIIKFLVIRQKAEVSRNDTDLNFTLAEYEVIAEQGISQLSPAKQAIFRMRMMNGLNNEEVSAQLGISINTVKCQYSQASKFLRDYLKNQVGI